MSRLPIRTRGQISTPLEVAVRVRVVTRMEGAGCLFGIGTGSTEDAIRCNYKLATALVGSRGEWHAAGRGGVTVVNEAGSVRYVAGQPISLTNNLTKET